MILISVGLVGGVWGKLTYGLIAENDPKVHEYFSSSLHRSADVPLVVGDHLQQSDDWVFVI